MTYDHEKDWQMIEAVLQSLDYRIVISDCGKTIRINRKGKGFIAKIDGIKSSFCARSASKAEGRAKASLWKQESAE